MEASNNKKKINQIKDLDKVDAENCHQSKNDSTNEYNLRLSRPDSIDLDFKVIEGDGAKKKKNIFIQFCDLAYLLITIQIVYMIASLISIILTLNYKRIMGKNIILTLRRIFDQISYFFESHSILILLFRFSMDPILLKGEEYLIVESSEEL